MKHSIKIYIDNIIDVILLAVRDDELYAFDQFFYGYLLMVQSDGYAFCDTVCDVRLLIAEHRYANHRHAKVHSLHNAHKATVGYECLDVPMACESTIMIL